MGRRCIAVNGVLMQIDGTATEKDLKALAEFAEWLKGAVPPLTPEQAERQDAATARRRERLARLGIS